MRHMNALSVFAALSIAGAAFAQAPNPPPQQASGPAAASSPHQRDTLSAPTTEATPSENPGPTGASSPHQRDSTRLAAADSGGVVSPGMIVQDRSGQSIGTVADVIPGKSGQHGFVVVSGKDGSATPVPANIAREMAKNGHLILDRAAFESAPKVQKSDISGSSGSAWERKADQYWQKHKD
jgi:hypothetical protein